VGSVDNQFSFRVIGSTYRLWLVGCAKPWREPNKLEPESENEVQPETEPPTEADVPSETAPPEVPLRPWIREPRQSQERRRGADGSVVLP
jgi:hypothetical protein